MPDVIGFTEKIIEQVSHAAHAASGADSDMADHAFASSTARYPIPSCIDNFGRLVLASHPVASIPSRRVQPLTQDMPHVAGVVWHTSDTPRGTGAAMARGIRDLPSDPRYARSWHLAVDVDHVYQAAMLTRGTWHAGGPSACRWARLPKPHDDQFAAVLATAPGAQHLPTANSVFAGVELVNVGQVRLVGGRWLGWPFGDPHKEADSGRSAEVTIDQVWEGPGWNGEPSHWHDFAPSQVDAAREIVEALHGTYSLPREAFGHSHHAIDPTRRDDPGPLWMRVYLPKILDEVFA